MGIIIVPYLSKGLPLRIKSFRAQEVIGSEGCLALNKHLMSVFFFSTFRSFGQLPSSYVSFWGPRLKGLGEHKKSSLVSSYGTDAGN